MTDGREREASSYCGYVTTLLSAVFAGLLPPVLAPDDRGSAGGPPVAYGCAAEQEGREQHAAGHKHEQPPREERRRQGQADAEERVVEERQDACDAQPGLTAAIPMDDPHCSLAWTLA